MDGSQSSCGRKTRGYTSVNRKITMPAQIKIAKGERAISTAEVKGAATPEASKELILMRDQILAIPKEQRDERTAKLRDLKETCSNQTRLFLDRSQLRELQHYWLMEQVLPKTEIKRRGELKQHDFSKDEVFFFAAASFFDGGVTDKIAKDFIFKEELVRHYTYEPHHPEYEKYNEGECTEEDIKEMGVDRLARNAQFGNGIATVDGVLKFTPEFTKGDNEAKKNIFRESVKKYIDLVQAEFYKMFPTAKEWANN